MGRQERCGRRGSLLACVAVIALVTSACQLVGGIEDIAYAPGMDAATETSAADATNDGSPDVSDGSRESSLPCTTSSTCPSGQACNPSTKQCGTSCVGGLTCNGGCCDGTSCAAGTAANACGSGGRACTSCTASSAGGACLGGSTCGCDAATDCPSGQACDVTNHTCTSSCSSTQPCHGGCCSAVNGGTCTAGTATNGCGNNGGLCSSCATSNFGRVCELQPTGGQCGCGSITDCGNGAAGCVMGQCSFTCSTTNPCQDGCCGSSMTCQTGTARAACGPNGTTCIDCMTSAAGPRCIPQTQQCGCNDFSDCPAGQACSVTHTCGTSCAGGLTCNGGCCNGTSCVAGDAGAACGASGGACSDCATSTNGSACVSNGTCGCNTAADCPSLKACGGLGMGNACSSFCAFGGSGSPCNGGCCSNFGMCAPGNTRMACGDNGMQCATCSGAQSCTAYVCQ